MKPIKKTPISLQADQNSQNINIKIKGRNLLVCAIKEISRLSLTKGKIKLSKADIEFPTQGQNIACVRRVPSLKQYVIEVVYERPDKSTLKNPKAVAAIDIGVDNLERLTLNQKGFT